MIRETSLATIYNHLSTIKLCGNVQTRVFNSLNMSRMDVLKTSTKCNLERFVVIKIHLMT